MQIPLTFKFGSYLNAAFHRKGHANVEEDMFRFPEEGQCLNILGLEWKEYSKITYQMIVKISLLYGFE